MLELKKIKKSYKVGETRQQVLNGINIKFRENEFVSILGQSGSGKTTLLNIIGGLDKYDDGELIIDGVSTKKYNDRDWDTYRNYRVGFIFQSYNLIMHQSVYQNVEIALTLSGVSKSARKKKIISVLEKVGLKDHIYKRPNQLSGGQMQRVAIARALVNDPEIILADEPTGALDSKTSVQIMDLLKEIASDKLVIMVTHNPELAKKYSTRIIELKDGLVIDDSNPCKDKEEVKERQMNKTSMSLLSALSLSFNNLLTKKGRTFLTGFAGSIGIIGIALILSLSNGVNNYAKQLEKDSLSDYPITIERTSYDLLGTISAAFSEAANQEKCDDDEICSTDDIVRATVIDATQGLAKVNNLKEFKKYIDSNEEFKKDADTIEYKYTFDLQVFTKDYNKVSPTKLTKEETSIFTELSSKSDTYKVLKGRLPENENELVLVIGEDNKINDSILYSLGIKDKEEITKELEKMRKDEKYRVKSTTYSYDDFIGKEFKLLLNTDYYKEENGSYIDYSNDVNYMRNKIDKAKTITIVGVVREKDGANSYIGYKPELTLDIINEISKTSLFKKQVDEEDINILTGQEFDGITTTYNEICKTLAIYSEDNPSSISIYPKDFDAKERIVKLIEKYNDEVKERDREDLTISYSDLLKSLVNTITKVVNIISYVLIGFVAISLIVSSIMISIITYISVLERTKEIGILRAIGASKKDIVRVFRAETIIEGAIAGILGIGIALLISVPVNVIVNKMAKVPNIASLPLLSAVFLILLSILLNVIAGSIPSKMAAKKDPVEALRTE